MLNTRQIARRFQKKTNFEITVKPKGKGDTDFFELKNHKHGITKGREPPMTLHLVSSHPDAEKLRGDFWIHRPVGSGQEHVVTAHYNGSLSISAKEITKKELAFALAQARILHRIMRSK